MFTMFRPSLKKKIWVVQVVLSQSKIQQTYWTSYWTCSCSMIRTENGHPINIIKQWWSTNFSFWFWHDGNDVHKAWTGWFWLVKIMSMWIPYFFKGSDWHFVTLWLILRGWIPYLQLTSIHWAKRRVTSKPLDATDKATTFHNRKVAARLFPKCVAVPKARPARHLWYLWSVVIWYIIFNGPKLIALCFVSCLSPNHLEPPVWSHRRYPIIAARVYMADYAFQA